MSIRSVQTSFTSAAPIPSTSDLFPWASPASSNPSHKVLAEIDMNYPSPTSETFQLHQASKYLPPGLGYYSMPRASESSPALATSHMAGHHRRRSGNYSYAQSHDTSYLVSGPNDLGLLSNSVGFQPQHQQQQPKRRLSVGHNRPRPSSPPNPIYRTSSPSSSSAQNYNPSKLSLSGYQAYQSSDRKYKFDPFGSDDTPVLTPAPLSNTYNHYWQYNPTHNSPVMTFKQSSSPPPPPPVSKPSNRIYNIKLPTASTVSLPATFSSSPVPVSLPLPKPDRNARARLVAGILLNRIYAVGRPMRKRSPSGTEKSYVKSGLSSVITVES